MTADKKYSTLSTVYKYIPRFIILLFFSFVSIVYLHNLTRDIYSGDIGDLVTASYVCGVAHPPGYPLFTMLGCFLSRLPLPIPPVTKVGLISTLSSLIGLYFYFKFCIRISRNLFISLLSTSILAFSYLFWMHAEVPEVFGLNNFFIIVLLYLGYLFYIEKKEKYVYLLSLMFGLAAAHHQTIVLLVPALLILVLKHFKYIVLNPRRMVLSILLAFIGFCVYLYVPIAASRNPPINWDNANNLNNLFHLILRKDYQTFGYGGLPIEARTIPLSNYAYTILNSFSYQIVLVAILGTIKLCVSQKRLALALLITFILSGPLFVMYIGSVVVTNAGWGVVERFYVFSSVVFMFFVPFGFVSIKELLDTKFSSRLYTYIILSYFILIPILLFQSNFPRTNISSTQIGNKLADDILNPLPANAILYVNGDTKTFNLWYAKHVLHKRPDVDLINPPGRAGNYYLDAEINKYFKSHPKTKPNEIVPKTLEVIRNNRPIFSTQPLDQIPKDSITVPYGMIYQLIYKSHIPMKQDYLKKIATYLKQLQPPTKTTLTLAEQNLITSEIPFFYSVNMLEIGNFLLYHYKDPSTAILFYKKAIDIDGENSLAFAGLGLGQLYSSRDCSNAKKNVEKAVLMYPIYRPFYAQLHIVYSQCNTDVQIIKALEQKYRHNFKEKIIVEVDRQKKLLKL